MTTNVWVFMVGTTGAQNQVIRRLDHQYSLLKQDSQCMKAAYEINRHCKPQSLWVPVQNCV